MPPLPLWRGMEMGMRVWARQADDSSRVRWAGLIFVRLVKMIFSKYLGSR